MKNYEIIKEGEQRLIFSRLDPLLRMLLASIDKLSSMLETNKQQQHEQDLHQTQTSSNCNNDTNDEINKSRSSQEILTLYKLQFGMMKDIETALQQLVLEEGGVHTLVNADHDNDTISNKQTKTKRKGQFKAARQTIHQMQRYILLPLILILQKPLPCSIDSNNKRNDDGYQQSVINVMIRNAARHCYEGAASCLKKIAEILCFDEIDIPTIANQNEYENENENENENEEQVNICMETNLRMKCVVAISQSLACIIQDVSMNQGNTLDKGEDCIMQLLACMKALIVRSRSRVPVGTKDSCKGREILDSSWKEFWVGFYSCRNGQLLHTIIHYITSILDSRWHSNHNYNDGNGVAGQQRLDSMQMDIKGNVELKLETLSLMRSLMTLGMDAHDAKLEDFVIGIEEEKQGRSVVDEWRSIFPGVFKALFREALLHVRFTTSQSSPKIATGTLWTLSVLLNRTMSMETMFDRYSCDINAADALLFASSVDGNLQKESSRSLPMEVRQFCINVHKTVPEPLDLLLKLIPMHKSLNVRRMGASALCKSILIDTNASWRCDVSDNGDNTKIGQSIERASSEELIIAALECIITMSTDDNDVLSTQCNVIIQSYRQFQGDREWNNHIREYIVPRITSLIETLPSYAKSGRETDLCRTIKLISGYLMTASDEDAKSSEKKKKKVKASKTILSKYLSHKLTKDPVRQSLVDLFTVDNTTKSSSKLIQYPGEISKGSSNIHYRYMRGTTVHVAKEMIHNVATVLGYKQTMLFLDECIADLYEIISTRIYHKRALFDLEHSRCIEKHFGLAVLATELLKSCEKKQNQKKSKTLDALASTLIPLICSDVLWQLPSKSNVFFGQSGRPGSNEQMVTALTPLHLQTVSTVDKTVISFEAYNGNGALLVCLMDVISTLAKSIGAKFDKFIPVILYPLIQKTSDLNSQSVQDGAHLALTIVSQVTGHSSVQNMLIANYGYLMETLTAELSNPYRTEVDLRSQAICFYSLHNIIEFLLKNEGGTEDKDVLETNLVLLTDMQSSMTSWFNQQFSRRSNELLRCIMVPMGLTSVLISCSTFLHKSLCTLLPVQEGDGVEYDDMTWTDLMLEFNIESKPATNEEKVETNNHDDDTPGTGKVTPTVISGCVLKRLTRDLQQVLTVNSTLLALPDLKLQRKSCELFRTAFAALSSIQRHAKMGDQGDTDITTIGNPLLETVSHHWPSLQIRFKTACSLFLTDAKSNDDPIPRRHVAILLASILEVVSDLSGLCGDFIADKFSNGIWPQISQLLTYFLKQTKSDSVSTVSPGDSELLLSILSCMNEMYSSKSCGKMLSNTTSIAGTIILPFLSHDNEIGEYAVKAIQSILLIDYDCLSRALLSLSGSDIPQRPILPHPNRANSQKLDPLLAKRSKDLIAFIESLPEQPLQ